MRRASFLLAVLVSACGPKGKPVELAPLPADNVPAEKPAEQPAEAPPEAEAPPASPIEVVLPAPAVSVKLLAPGKGKREPLRYAATAGAVQQLELALEFAGKQTAGGETQEQLTPTMILAGAAEARTVADDGRVEYAIAVRDVDARDRPATAKPMADKFKLVLQSLVGLEIASSVAPSGAPGPVTLRIAKPEQMSAQALELVRLTLPALPVLPAEPIAPGAKWQAIQKVKLADRFDVTHTTTYELVSRKGATAVVKGTSKVTGPDQDLTDEHGQPQGKVSGITGAGTVEATFTAGALYPALTSKLDTSFEASEGGQSMKFAITAGAAVTVK